MIRKTSVLVVALAFMASGFTPAFAKGHEEGKELRTNKGKSILIAMKAKPLKPKKFKPGKTT